MLPTMIVFRAAMTRPGEVAASSSAFRRDAHAAAGRARQNADPWFQALRRWVTAGCGAR